MPRHFWIVAVLALSVTVGCSSDARGQKQLFLASTTSTQDSGLLDALVPAFEDETGYDVKVISGGSGQAIENGRRGDVDVLLVHSPDAEKQMAAAGYGVERALVMHNDFILVGPEADPAGVRVTDGINAAMQAISSAGASFVSRGDDSGTHVLETKLWAAVSIDPTGEDWYEESGQGQGATLQIASQHEAYAVTDRGTFLAQRANLDLIILSEKSPGLLNYYHVIVVNPEKHSNVNAAGARAWAAWVVGAKAQQIIRDFGVAQYGEPLFIADAGQPDPTE